MTAQSPPASAVWDVLLPCGCVVQVTQAAMDRLGTGGQYRTTIGCDPAHEPVALELELLADARVLRARAPLVGLPLPTAQRADPAEPATPVVPEIRVNQVCRWRDRLGLPRVGRVAALDGPYANVVTMGGGIAMVPQVWLEPDDAGPGPARSDGELLAALDGAAQRGVQAAVVAAYDVLTESDPSPEGKGDRRVKAAIRVYELARDLRDRVVAERDAAPAVAE